MRKVRTPKSKALDNVQARKGFEQKFTVAERTTENIPPEFLVNSGKGEMVR